MSKEQHDNEKGHLTASEVLAAQIEAEDAEDAKNPNTPKKIVSPDDWASGGVTPREN